MVQFLEVPSLNLFIYARISEAPWCPNADPMNKFDYELYRCDCYRYFSNSSYYWVGFDKDCKFCYITLSGTSLNCYSIPNK